MDVSLDLSSVCPTTWDFYKKQVASFWTVEEVDLETDAKDVDTLTDGERTFVHTVLAFFASSDIVVADNAQANFAREFPEREVRFCYDFQAFMENIHSEMYSTLLDRLVRDEAERTRLLRIASTDSSVATKVEWMRTWMDDSLPLSDRLVAFACVEGIFFSASFCAIYYFKKRGLMPGLCFSNELIARDEGMHRDFACHLYQTRFAGRQGGGGGGKEVAPLVDIVKDAVRVEQAFVREALPVALIGMNAESMCRYVEFVADNLLLALGVSPQFEVTNPFEWMELISLQGKTNFFEKRVSEYRKAGVGQREEERRRVLVTDLDDF